MIDFILWYGVLPVFVFAVAFLIEKKPWRSYESFADWQARIVKKLKNWWSTPRKKRNKKRKKLSGLKKLYIFVATVIGATLFGLFCALSYNAFAILLNLNEENEFDSNFALAFIGTITGGVALFTGFIAILRNETNERQSKAAERQSRAAIEQNKIAKETNIIADKQNTITEEQNKVAQKEINRQTESAERQAKIAERQAQIAERQAHTAEQEAITDRLSKATDGLGKVHENGKPVLEVRLGFLYELERIAQDSIRDHIRIMETLCVYIRHNSPKTDTPEVIREDIQAAITIIGRRDKWDDGKEYLEKENEQKYRLDLRNCNLHGALLADANLSKALFNDVVLSNAKLNKANLSYANLDDSDINNANLDHTNLNYASFRKANVSDVWFFRANLNEVHFLSTKLNNVRFYNADLSNTRFNYAVLDNALFTDAKTRHASISNCNFSKCREITQNQLEDMFCGIEVEIPEDLTRPEHWPTDELDYDGFSNAYDDWKKENP